ncbi:MAG: GIY-YIG nuclease family protein [Mobilitalea sp.]
MDRKNELKQQYKLRKPDMGIFIIRSKINNKYFLQSTKDLRGVMNGAKFKLATGTHPNRELQSDWKASGEDNFIIEILERLECNEEESKTDYSEELNLMELIWEEKFTKENLELYRK